MLRSLETGIRNAKNVSRYLYGSGAIHGLESILSDRRKLYSGYVVYFVDLFFRGQESLSRSLSVRDSDCVVYINADNEPTTSYVNELRKQVAGGKEQLPHTVIGMGGGSTMDVAKAVSNLLTNSGSAEDYQGWDLVENPGIYKIGIPTISGTGAEATRTCVMINPVNGLKLGMNSDHTVFDQLILDPDLSRTVPRSQYFYTGMDTYVHCVESLAGQYRNAVGDAFSEQAIKLCREVFFSDDMQSDENRQKLMVASYLGGCAIATSYVGVLHPFSAGLSVVLGTHHCLANCITMMAMGEFYPQAVEEFLRMATKQGIEIPKGICRDLSESQYDRLHQATIIHEKPLTNALGENFRSKLTRTRVADIFGSM